MHGIRVCDCTPRLWHSESQWKIRGISLPFERLSIEIEQSSGVGNNAILSISIVGYNFFRPPNAQVGDCH